MKRLIINAKDHIKIDHYLLGVALKAANDMEIKLGERDRITVTLWKSANYEDINAPDDIAAMAHSKNIHDSGGIYLVDGAKYAQGRMY